MKTLKQMLSLLAVIVLASCQTVQASRESQVQPSAVPTQEYPRATVQAFAVMSFKDAQSRLHFSVPLPVHLPPGLVLKGAHVDPPNWIHYFYNGKSNLDVLEIEVSKGASRFSYAYPDSAKVPLMINNSLAMCMHGAWDGKNVESWKSDVDATAIQWTSQGFAFRVAQRGLRLDCEALAEVAESLQVAK